MNVPEAIPEKNGGRDARKGKDQRMSEHRGLVLVEFGGEVSATLRTLLDKSLAGKLQTDDQTSRDVRGVADATN